MLVQSLLKRRKKVFLPGLEELTLLAWSPHRSVALLQCSRKLIIEFKIFREIPSFYSPWYKSFLSQDVATLKSEHKNWLKGVISQLDHSNNLEGEDLQDTIQMVNRAEEGERARRMSIPFSADVEETELDISIQSGQLSNVHTELLHLFAIHDVSWLFVFLASGCSLFSIHNRVKTVFIHTIYLAYVSQFLKKTRQLRQQHQAEIFRLLSQLYYIEIFLGILKKYKQ